MAEENVEIVRRMYAAFQGGDAAGALECFHPDVEIDATRGRPDTEPGRGREAVARTIGSWVASFDDWDEEIEEIRDLGGTVYVIARQRGRGKGSGVEIHTRYGILYDVSDGRITRMRMYIDPADALAAAEAEG
jgi:ketosteroid isomerase-like protein